ncbi:unnamed protein product [Prunus armeniaca]
MYVSIFSLLFLYRLRQLCFSFTCEPWHRHFLSIFDRRLHQSKDGGRTGRFAHLPNHDDPTIKSRPVKRGVDSSLLTPLEVRMAAAKKERESSTTLAVNPKVDKSGPTGDAGVSDLVDQICQAGDLGTFSSLSLEKQREATFHSALTRYERKKSDLRAMISELKSFFAEKDSNFSSSTADLAGRKDAYFRLEHKNANISLSYDKLLASVALLAYVEDVSMSVALLAYVQRCVGECGSFGLHPKTCQREWPVWPTSRDVSVRVGRCPETCR